MLMETKNLDTISRLEFHTMSWPTDKTPLRSIGARSNTTNLNRNIASASRTKSSKHPEKSITVQRSKRRAPSESDEFDASRSKSFDLDLYGLTPDDDSDSSVTSWEDTTDGIRVPSASTARRALKDLPAGGYRDKSRHTMLSRIPKVHAEASNRPTKKPRNMKSHSTANVQQLTPQSSRPVVRLSDAKSDDDLVMLDDTAASAARGAELTESKVAVKAESLSIEVSIYSKLILSAHLKAFNFAIKWRQPSRLVPPPLAGSVIPDS